MSLARPDRMAWSDRGSRLGQVPRGPAHVPDREVRAGEHLLVADGSRHPDRLLRMRQGAVQVTLPHVGPRDP